MDNDDFEDVFEWLRNLQRNGLWDEIDVPENIIREVVASQALAGITVKQEWIDERRRWGTE